MKRDKWFTYSSFSNCAFSEFVKVNEEFLDSDSVFSHGSLESFFNVKLYVHVVGLLLLSGRMETVHHRDSY